MFLLFLLPAFGSSGAAGPFGDDPPEVVVRQARARLVDDFDRPLPAYLCVRERVAVTMGEIRKATFDMVGELLVWDLGEGRLKHRIELPARIAALGGIRGSGRVVVAGGPVNKDFNPAFVCVVDLREGAIVAELPAGHKFGPDLDLRLSGDGRTAVVRYARGDEVRYFLHRIPRSGQDARPPETTDASLWNRLDPLPSEDAGSVSDAPNWMERVGDVDSGFALATVDTGAALWRTDTWEKIADLGAYSAPWSDWAPSVDGSRLVSWRGGLEGGLTIWDLETFRVTSLDAPGFHRGIVPAFGPRNRFLRFARFVDDSNAIEIVSRGLSSGEETVARRVPSEPFDYFAEARVRGAFSPNGRHFLATPDAGKTAFRITWDEAGEASSTPTHAAAAIPIFVSDGGATGVFAEKRDGAGFDDRYAVEAVELESGRSLHRWTVETVGHAPSFGGAVDSSGTLVLSHHTTGASLGYYGGDALVVRDGKRTPIPGFRVGGGQPPTERNGHAWSVAFTEVGDEELATVHSLQGRFVTFSTESERIVHEFRWSDYDALGGDDEGFPVATRLVAGEAGRVFLPVRNGGIRVIDLAVDGRTVHRADLWSLPGNGWFAVTPDGHYACSVGSERHVFFRRGDTLHPFEQFDAHLNRPDLVAAALGADGDTVEALRRAHRRRLAKLGDSGRTSPPDFAAAPEVAWKERPPLVHDAPSLSLEVAATTGAGRSLRDLHVFADGVRLHPALLDDPSGRPRFEGAVPVPLSPGANRIEFVAEDDLGRLSTALRAPIHRTAGGARPNLYVLAIGVSDYRDDDFDLTFPAKDARDLGEALEKAATGFDRVFRREILDADATREGILDGRAFLRRSRPGDRVVVFAAGHGLLDDDYRYFFGATDMDFGDPSERGMGFEELESLFDGVPARERLLLMDTCQAGSVDVALLESLERGETTGLPENVTVASNEGLRAAAVPTARESLKDQRFVEELFTDLEKDSGATVIAASGGLEFALESPEWNNGIFTYAVIEAIGNPTGHDRDGDGVMRASELVDAVADTVVSMTGGLQHPTARAVNLAVDFPVVGIVGEQDREPPLEFLERYLDLSSTSGGRPGSIDRILSLFADEVDYFGDRLTPREIGIDLRQYNARYDERTYRLEGSPVVSRESDDVTIDYRMRFEVGFFEDTVVDIPGRGPTPSKTRAYRDGELKMRMRLKRLGAEWKITALGAR